MAHCSHKKIQSQYYILSKTLLDKNIKLIKNKNCYFFKKINKKKYKRKQMKKISINLKKINKNKTWKI